MNKPDGAYSDSLLTSVLQNLEGTSHSCEASFNWLDKMCYAPIGCSLLRLFFQRLKFLQFFDDGLVSDSFHLASFRQHFDEIVKFTGILYYMLLCSQLKVVNVTITIVRNSYEQILLWSL